MLHILLLILKIVGIILAVLIGFILLSLCLVLFVPVRYSIKLNRSEAEGSPPVVVNARITWLLRFINVRIIYPSDVYLKARVMFFTVFRLPWKNKEDKKVSLGENNKKSKENKRNKELNKNSEEDRNDEKYEKHENCVNDEKCEEYEEHEEYKDDKNDIKNINEKDKGGGEGNAKDNILKNKIVKIINIFKNILYTIKGICDKIKDILNDIEYYLDIIKSDTFKQAFSLCKDELCDIFNYIKPGKFEADLTIGTGDPASTGTVMSYYGILYPFIGHNITVTGDFEEKRIEGSAYIKGRIKFFTFLKAAIHIYFNKDIKKLLKLFKKEDE